MQENSEEDEAASDEKTTLDKDDEIPISTEDLSKPPIEKTSITWL